MSFSKIVHSGVGHEDDPPGRGSGRYSWGSGKNPHQHQFSFLSEVDKLRKDGMKDSEIAQALLGEKARSVDLRAKISIEKNNERRANRARAIALLDACNGNVSEVGRKMGLSESSVRSLLDPVKGERMDRYQNTANMLKKIVDEKGMIDITSGTGLYLGVPENTKDIAVSILKEQGYLQSWVSVPQVGGKGNTTVKVLASPEYTHADVQKNKFNIKPIQTFTPDEGKTWWSPEFPESVDSKRIQVRYKEDGGQEKDGTIELRRGVEDLSLGGSQYAQVRIAVDGTHYMKGMAIYGDNMPEGVDIIYNTNKSKGTPLMDPSGGDNEVLKKMKIDPKTGEVDRENPFGALIKSPKEKDGVIYAGGQRHYIGEDGKEHLSPINKLREEGEWNEWSRNLASQFLSKQPLKLINQQMDISLADKKNELEQINSLTNPVIRKKLLEDFAAVCDSNAVDLSVKGFKNQAFQVLLPIPTMKDNEIYAPNFEDGDTLSLIRYPHGGTFEIPILKVNNKQPDAKKVMKNAEDAVGISMSVADRLSGADFDGDTAVVIPLSSNRLAVKSTAPLEGLKDFNPKEIYKLPDDAPKMKNSTKQNEMGQVTNLITDMTVGGASPSEICRAVKHSMVVIDAEKHHLDYKQSAKDNNIVELKKSYQGVNPVTNQPKGASTILSRSTSEIYIDQRKQVNDKKKMTPDEIERWNNGEIIWHKTNKKKMVVIDDPTEMTPDELDKYRAGKKVYRQSSENVQEKAYQMSVVRDAMELVRDPDNLKEVAYANYANNLKGLANDARKSARSILPIPVSKSAKETYSKEVDSLMSKLRIAQMNAPRERQAQMIANARCEEKFKSNPNMDFEHRQREAARALDQARAEVGAKKDYIPITDKEWEAIQANAISTSRLQQILMNTDQDAFKKRATPRRSSSEPTSNQISLIMSMYNSGMYTQKEIADRLGVSTSTISKIIKSQ